MNSHINLPIEFDIHLRHGYMLSKSSAEYNLFVLHASCLGRLLLRMFP
jgi:hypothetical protein